jgi:hypothetical protein
MRTAGRWRGVLLFETYAASLLGNEKIMVWDASVPEDVSAPSADARSPAGAAPCARGRENGSALYIPKNGLLTNGCIKPVHRSCDVAALPVNHAKN